MSWGGQNGVVLEDLDDNVRRVVDICVVWWHLFLHHEDGTNFERTMFSQIWPNTMNQDEVRQAAGGCIHHNRFLYFAYIAHDKISNRKIGPRGIMVPKCPKGPPRTSGFHQTSRRNNSPRPLRHRRTWTRPKARVKSREGVSFNCLHLSCFIGSCLHGFSRAFLFQHTFQKASKGLKTFEIFKNPSETY